MNTRKEELENTHLGHMVYQLVLDEMEGVVAESALEISTRTWHSEMGRHMRDSEPKVSDNTKHTKSFQ